MGPAIAALLARALPMIEGAAASGSAGSAASAGGASAGLAGGIGRLLGGTGGALSEAQLGGALRRVEDIANLVSGIGESQQMLSAQQTATAATARHEERDFMMSDPTHGKTLAALEHQRVANEKQRAALQREAAALERRIAATTGAGQGGGLSGLGSLASAGAGYAFGGGFGGGSADQGLAAQIAGATAQARTARFGPLSGLVQKLPFMQLQQNLQQGAMQPFTDLGVGKAEGAVMGSMANFGGKAAEIASNPLALMKGEGFTHLAKLPGLLKEWGEGLVESKRHLAEFSGVHAMIFAEEERRGIMRNIRSGAATGGATADLSKKMQDIADRTQGMRDNATIVITRVVERGLVVLERMLISIELIYAGLKTMPVIGDALTKIEEELKKAGEDKNKIELPIHRFMREVEARNLSGSGLHIPRVPKR